jgi:hypothetical protein
MGPGSSAGTTERAGQQDDGQQIGAFLRAFELAIIRAATKLFK